MRISYLIPGPMGRTAGGEAELDRRCSLLQQYAASGTEVGGHDVPEGPASIESMCEGYLSIPATMRRALELQSDGWECVILGCFGDPGLAGFRELMDVPTVGPGEATALVAASLGHRYSVITVTDSIVAPIEQQLRSAGVADKLASVRAMSIPVLELHTDLDRTIEAATDAGRTALTRDRADTLILGCMSMGFLGVSEAIAGHLGVPVLNPAKVALKFAEMILGSGLTHSRRAYMPPPKLASGKVSSALELIDLSTGRETT